jgi:hypothetical protein
MHLQQLQQTELSIWCVYMFSGIRPDDAQTQSVLCSILSKKLHDVLVILNAKYINDLPNMIEDKVRVEIGFR